MIKQLIGFMLAVIAIWIAAFALTFSIMAAAIITVGVAGMLVAVFLFLIALSILVGK